MTMGGGADVNKSWSSNPIKIAGSMPAAGVRVLAERPHANGPEILPALALPPLKLTH